MRHFGLTGKNQVEGLSGSAHCYTSKITSMEVPEVQAACRDRPEQTGCKSTRAPSQWNHSGCVEFHHEGVVTSHRRCYLLEEPLRHSVSKAFIKQTSGFPEGKQMFSTNCSFSNLSLQLSGWLDSVIFSF